MYSIVLLRIPAIVSLVFPLENWVMISNFSSP